MANSIITVLGDGVTTQYSIPFTLGILKRQYVTCRVGDEVDGLGAPVYRTLEWITDSLVNIQGTVPGDDVPIVFRRTMPKTALIHDYSDGSAITEENLDESNLQHIMSIHEFLDGRLEAGFVQDLPMNGYRITGLGEGVEDDDAATMAQINAVIGDATDQADLAQEWATNTTSLVEATDNSAKAYAIGGTGVTNTSGKGAAKEWATKLASTVDTAGYSAKEHAVGDLTATGGSAKAWAIDASSPDGTSNLSAKSYAALTAADRVQTGADRVQTGLDVIAADLSRQQAEAAANGMKYRSVRVATTGNITLSGLQTIDAISVAADDRVLVRAQSTPAQNGLYLAKSGSWVRSSDGDTWNELVGVVVVVEEGTTNGDKTFLCTSNTGGTIGSTAVTFVDWNANIPDASVALTKLSAIAANSIVANLTGSSAGPTATALGTSTILGRGASGNAAALSALSGLVFGSGTIDARTMSGRGQQVYSTNTSLTAADMDKIIVPQAAITLTLPPATGLTAGATIVISADANTTIAAPAGMSTNLTFVRTGCTTTYVYDGGAFWRGIHSGQHSNPDFTTVAGWCRLPGGLIVQWKQGVSTGAIGGAGNASQTINFPVTFPNACLSVMIQNTGSPNLLNNTLTAMGTTSCTVNVANCSGSTYSCIPYIIAIGH